nr:nuclear transport factor 2 family protein [Pseudopedobacter sp.]
MKKTFFLFVFVALSFSVFAQNAQQKVAAATEFLRQALISGNQIDLKKIVADDLSYGHSSGEIQNKIEFVNALVSKQSDFVTIDLKDQTIKIIGRTAIVRHLLYATTNDGGKPGEVKLGIMLVFEKQHGDWVLLARQAYKI